MAIGVCLDCDHDLCGGSHQFLDLAEVMIEQYAPKFGLSPKDIKINIIGKRNGEKLFEELLTEEDSERAYECDKIIIICPQTLRYEEPARIPSDRGCIKSALRSYSSSKVPLLTKDQIRDTLLNIL